MQKASTAQQQQKPGANVSFHFLNYDRSLLLTPYNVVVAKKIGTNVNWNDENVATLAAFVFPISAIRVQAFFLIPLSAIFTHVWWVESSSSA